MIPYLATVVDSLREAIASRVLWIVIGLITLTLVLLAPLGYHEELSVGLQGNDVRDWNAFLVQFRDASAAEEPSPARHLASLFDEKFRERLDSLRATPPEELAATIEAGGIIRAFRRALQDTLGKPEFHNEEAWRNHPALSEEMDDLRKKDVPELSEKELQRYNRLWLEAAFPDFVQVSLPTSIQLHYAGWDFGPPQVLREDQFVKTLKSIIVLVMGWFIGTAGVLVAILVTAPIIPQMFDPGSLSLLLSKPVSRWLLFLAKFFGGCGFIGIATVYLIGGLCLILRLRFGIWDPKLLWSIPLYLLVFSILYAVSAFAGVIWRNSIVSVACAVVFWIACISVGTAKTLWDSTVIIKTRFAQILPTPAGLLAVNEMGITHAWKGEERQWKRVFLSNEQRQVMPAYYLMPTIPRQIRPVGPVYDEHHGQLVMTMFSLRRSRAILYSGKADQNWEPKPSSATPPLGTFQLLREPSGKILAVSSMGLQRLEGDMTAAHEPVKLFGVTLPLPSAGPFRTVSPEEPVVLTQPADVAVDGRSGALVGYSRNTLLKLIPAEDGRFQLEKKREFEKTTSQAALVAIGGETLIVARDDGKVLVLDGASLETRQEFQPEKENQPKFVAASPDGNWFAVGFHTGRLFLYDAQHRSLSAADVAGQGTISAATFTAQNELLVIDRGDRLSRYALPSCRVVERLSPPADLWTNLYRYALVPCYTVFPKPGELDKTFRYLLFEQETSGADAAQKDLTALQTRIDPWAPLWSSLLFTLCVLVLACLYIEWQEF